MKITIQYPTPPQAFAYRLAKPGERYKVCEDGLVLFEAVGDSAGNVHGSVPLNDRGQPEPVGFKTDTMPAREQRVFVVVASLPMGPVVTPTDKVKHGDLIYGPTVSKDGDTLSVVKCPETDDKWFVAVSVLDGKTWQNSSMDEMESVNVLPPGTVITLTVE